MGTCKLAKLAFTYDHQMTLGPCKTMKKALRKMREYLAEAHPLVKQFIFQVQKTSLDWYATAYWFDPVKDNWTEPVYRKCEACGKPTRDTTAGCDHCDLEDK